MIAPQRTQRSNSAAIVGELFTEAKIEALNEMLVERGIPAERIISILAVPGQTLANPTPAQFRVLYRTS